ncbi:flagellar motor switch protein FliN [Candidatus Poribacteria bacterium]|nr:flagellar motor switch protein FliN [Candidatus Poribacteria bacterium]
MDASNHGQETPENANAMSSLNSAFAGALAAILESAAAAFPITEESDIRFSVALVGEMGKEEFFNLARELPVVAEIALDKDIGDRAAMLTDIPTAAALAGFVSGGEPTGKDRLSDADIISLHEALNPILDALSSACEEATGRPFGSIESVEVPDAAALRRKIEELPDSLYRATASVSVGSVANGRIAIILPLNLADALAEAASRSRKPEEHPYEHIEPKGKEDVSVRAQGQATREPSMENIDLILDIQLRLSARLGQVEMPIAEILDLAPGSVIDIDRFVDEPVELVVNDHLIARGEIVVVQENFGVKITEIVSPKERIKSLR